MTVAMMTILIMMMITKISMILRTRVLIKIMKKMTTLAMRVCEQN